MTTREAIEDLPRLTAHLEGRDRKGTRVLDGVVEYREDVTPSAYARSMRSWPGFATNGVTTAHVTRCLTQRDYRLFERLDPGDDYPRALALAKELFGRHMAELGAEAPRRGSARWRELRRRYVPPYDPGKFPNKWRKMAGDEPARTLMAHLSKDTYSHIHYDSEQARTITVREAARLQSFPDGFVFRGSMNPAFRQIGNSVPPVMAAAIARQLLGSVLPKGRQARMGGEE